MRQERRDELVNQILLLVEKIQEVPTKLKKKVRGKASSWSVNSRRRSLSEEKKGDEDLFVGDIFKELNLPRIRRDQVRSQLQLNGNGGNDKNIVVGNGNSNNHQPKSELIVVSEDFLAGAAAAMEALGTSSKKQGMVLSKYTIGEKVSKSQPTIAKLTGPHRIDEESDEAQPSRVQIDKYIIDVMDILITAPTKAGSRAILNFVITAICPTLNGEHRHRKLKRSEVPIANLAIDTLTKIPNVCHRLLLLRVKKAVSQLKK